jgi:hypothetical protein
LNPPVADYAIPRSGGYYTHDQALNNDRKT